MMSSHWRAAWAIACETCGSDVGRQCRSIHTGRLQFHNHATRTLRWQQLQRRNAAMNER